MKIAVVSASYQDGLHYIQGRFSNQITEYNRLDMVFTLKDGSKIHNCFGDPSIFKSFTFDAYIVTPNYETLEDVIKHRCMRVV